MIACIEDPMVIRKILNYLQEKSSLDLVVQLPKVSAGSAALDAKQRLFVLNAQLQRPRITHKKRPHPNQVRPFINKSWRCPTLTWGDPTLPSALSVFTSEFEKGSGGSHSLLPPENWLVYPLKQGRIPNK